MIRILHCLPGNMNMGGIESYLMNIYRNIDRKKIQFDFIIHSSNENYYEKEIKKLGGKIFRLPNKADNIKEYKTLFTTLLKEHPEYKIIHIHAVYAFSKIEAKIAKENGLKVIFHSHNKNAIIKRKLVHYFMKYNLDKYVDLKIACSLDAAKWMFNKNTIKNKEYYIWNNMIDSNKFIYNPEIRKQIREKYDINQSTLVIGSVGRLDYQKNPFKLIKIFKEINKKNPNSILFIIGEGDLKNKLEKKIRKYDLNNKVYLLGNKNNVNDYLQSFDIFLLPTRYEGLGIVLIEAQAAGLKCFTSKNKVPKETNITNLINYVSLYKSNKYWSDLILSLKKYKRLNRQKEIISAKFDNRIIKEVEDFYLSL